MLPTAFGWVIVIAIVGAFYLLIRIGGLVGEYYDLVAYIREWRPQALPRPWLRLTGRRVWIMVILFLAGNLAYTLITGHRG